MLKALDKLKAKIYSLIKVKGKSGADLLYMGERVRVLRKPVILTLDSDIGSYVWKKANGMASISLKSEPNPHMLIVGSSGYGKSYLLKSLICQVSSGGIPVLILDAHNEHEKVVEDMGGKVARASEYGINILDLDGESVQTRIHQVSKMLKEVYSLGYVQEIMLRRCLFYTYRKAGCTGRWSDSNTPPSVHDLLNEIRIFISNSRSSSERNSLEHMYGRLSQLDSDVFSRGFVSVTDLFNGITSFSLAALGTGELKSIYIYELLRRIYLKMKSEGESENLRLLIAIDEADFVLCDSGEMESTARSLVSEGRKYGVGFIAATHTATKLDPQIIENASTIIAFCSREPSEMSYISRILSRGNDSKVPYIKIALGNLGVGMAITCSYKTSADVVRIRNYDSRGNVHASLRSRINHIQITYPAFPVKFNDYVQNLATNSGIDITDAETLVKRAITAGHLSYFKPCIGAGAAYVMRPSRNLSIEHEASLASIAEEAKKAGIELKLLSSPNNPDAEIFVRGERIGIEYETGKKNIVESVRMISMRTKKYGRVVVVANPSVLKHYKEVFSGIREVMVIPINEVPDFLNSLARKAGDGAFRIQKNANDSF
jgi:hypothetical protein